MRAMDVKLNDIQETFMHEEQLAVQDKHFDVQFGDFSNIN